MTQEVITDIKLREKEEKDSSPSHYMSAVAQHFIDNNLDITWREIIDALLDANEVSICRKYLGEGKGIKAIIISFKLNHNRSEQNSCKSFEESLFTVKLCY